VPPLQLAPGPHALPQLPQFVSLLSGLPSGHRHAPLWHVVPLGHVVPHEPQLFSSADVSTQPPEPQSVSPVAQLH